MKRTGRLARTQLCGALILALAALTILAAPAGAQMPPTPDTFTAQVADALNRQAPPQPVRVVSALTLMATTATGVDAQINLDRLYTACRSNQERCPEIVRTYADNTLRLLRERPAQLAQTNLRAVVRPVAYLRSLPALPGGPVPSFSGSLPPGLLALVYQDTPTAMRLVNPDELQALHLSPEQAFAVALQNTTAEWQPLTDAIKPLAPGQVGGFRGGAYESSRLLRVADWADTAARFGGHLLVAAPSAEELLYANGSGADALPRLSSLAHTRFAQAERPTSAAVLEWRPSGWVVVSP